MNKTSKIIWLGILAALLIGSVIVIFFIYKMPQPSYGKNCHAGSSASEKWNDSCTYINELSFDSSLSSPSSLSLNLLKFEKIPGAGNPLNLPMWYRFRYVNANTGGYSDFSKWTASPVYAGSDSLPCVAGIGSCSTQYVPANTCNFNQPTIGIATNALQYPLMRPMSSGQTIYANVHRYVGTSLGNSSEGPTPPCNQGQDPATDNCISVQDEIIGVLMPPVTMGGVQYNSIIDVLDNPCQNASQCPAPSNC